MSGGISHQDTNLVLSNQRGSGDAPSASSFFYSVLSIGGGQIGCIAIAVLSELCFARLLGPVPRGLISMSSMAIAFGAMLGSLGSEATVVLWISRVTGRRSTWFPAVALWVLTGCILSASAWAVIYWRFHFAFLKGLTPALALLVLASIPVAVWFSVSMAMLAGQQEFRLRSWISLANRLVSLAAFLFCVPLLGRHAETAIFGNLAGLLVGVGIAVYFLRDFFPGIWKLREARQHFMPTIAFGIRGQAGNLASFFSYRLDVFIVNYFLDASQVGLYALGVLVSEALWQLPGIVALALFPRTARTLGAGTDDFTCMVLRQVSLITALGAGIIAAASPVAIPLLFGKRFAPSVPVIWWILPGTIALSFAKVIAADLSGRGLNLHLPISAGIGLVFTLALDLFLIPRLGIQGAALASSVAYSMASAYLLVVIQRELKRSWRELLLPGKNELSAYRKLWLLLRSRISPESLELGPS